MLTIGPVKICEKLCISSDLLIIGENLKRLREEHHISQEKLCEELQRRHCDILLSRKKLGKMDQEC